MAKIELININKSYSKSESPNLFLNKANIFTLKINKPSKSKNNLTLPFSISDLNLTIPDGETVVILGPSGCGKTTLLKIISGLEKQDSGTILFNDIDMNNSEPKDRKIGMVFQNYALYPHMTSKKNILTYYIFKKKTQETNLEAEEKFEKTSEMLGVDIKYLLDRNPGNLSGGERQRVAIGRCITRDPAVFLMDEPLSNLDARLREKYRIQLKILLKKFHITTVYVTHDQQEALILADTLVVMNNGIIEQVGTFEEIYQNPQNLFVAEFVNPNTETTAINLIDGSFISEKYKDIIIGAHPEDIDILVRKKEKAISGKIIDIREIPVKKSSILGILVGEREIYAKVQLKANFTVNQNVWLLLNKYYLFDRISGERINKNIALSGLLRD